MIRISIITVCYNSERYIEQTIKSVISQSYPNIEYIIVDGLSTDDTPRIIDRYRDHISFFISGKDKNMYDAINKGMRASSGDYIAILNSDDYYLNNHVVQDIVDAINADCCHHSFYYGNLWKYYETLNKYKQQKKIQTTYYELLSSRKLSFVGHGTVFISRKLYSVVGEYDCNRFRAAADFDFLLRCFKYDKGQYCDVDIQAFRVHNQSITSSGQISNEIETVLATNGYYEINKYRRFFYRVSGWCRFVTKNLLFSLVFKFRP